MSRQCHEQRAGDRRNETPGSADIARLGVADARTRERHCAGERTKEHEDAEPSDRGTSQREPARAGPSDDEYRANDISSAYGIVARRDEPVRGE